MSIWRLRPLPQKPLQVASFLVFAAFDFLGYPKSYPCYLRKSGYFHINPRQKARGSESKKNANSRPLPRNEIQCFRGLQPVGLQAAKFRQKIESSNPVLFIKKLP